MSRTVVARMRPDGTVVEVLADGSEHPFPETPMRPMTQEEIEAAANADPDARPFTSEELAKDDRNEFAPEGVRLPGPAFRPGRLHASRRRGGQADRWE